MTARRGDDVAAIVAAAEVPYSRHPPTGTTTTALLADAFVRVLQAADIERDEVDGLGVASFTLAPDHAIDLAWRLGVRLRWLMEDPHGGVSALNLLQHALHAVESGEATNVVLLAGDHFAPGDFERFVTHYNRATSEHLAPIPTGGPNAQFALLTQRHMARHELGREDYAGIPVSQRAWAARNPGAVYREPLSVDDYLAAPVVAPPLGRYDCVPVVSGADAVLVSRAPPNAPGVRVRALRSSFNHDNQLGDGLTTGLDSVAAEFWDAAGFGPQDVDLACVYDDYPVMVLIQLDELGFVLDGDVRRFVRERLEGDRWPLNPSGGQLSAGQAGAAGGMHGLVEAVQQLLGLAGEHQVEGARRAVVTGYGMLVYLHGGCAAVAALESTG
ncbi:MAG: thiolase family protein [Actinobacteria bacterium]|nr:thiolase family protein [Actinomycetota bacterium]